MVLPEGKKYAVGQWSVPCHLYFNKTLIGQKPGRKCWWGDQTGSRGGDKNRKILKRGTRQSAVVTQPQRKPDENPSLAKANTDKNNGLM